MHRETKTKAILGLHTEIIPNDLLSTAYSHLVLFSIVQSGGENWDVPSFPKGEKAGACFMEKTYMLDTLIKYALSSLG